MCRRNEKWKHANSFKQLYSLFLPNPKGLARGPWPVSLGKRRNCSSQRRRATAKHSGERRKVESTLEEYSEKRP